MTNDNLLIRKFFRESILGYKTTDFKFGNFIAKNVINQIHTVCDIDYIVRSIERSWIFGYDPYLRLINRNIDVNLVFAHEILNGLGSFEPKGKAIFIKFPMKTLNKDTINIYLNQDLSQFILLHEIFHYAQYLNGNGSIMISDENNYENSYFEIEAYTFALCEILLEKGFYFDNVNTFINTIKNNSNNLRFVIDDVRSIMLNNINTVKQIFIENKEYLSKLVKQIDENKLTENNQNNKRKYVFGVDYGIWDYKNMCPLKIIKSDEENDKK